jgi:hypothetical protein
MLSLLRVLEDAPGAALLAFGAGAGGARLVEVATLGGHASSSFAVGTRFHDLEQHRINKSRLTGNVAASGSHSVANPHRALVDQNGLIQ